ncbi:MAG: M20 family metallo-hydrolase [Burkholderiales bacterium]|nr:M20 family metallo-hydrolase [Burkholderiales bacterium]
MHELLDRCVSQLRLARLIEALSRFGAREDGGVDRQAMGEADIAAREFLVDRAAALGCTAMLDESGNLFLRRAGVAASAAAAPARPAPSSSIDAVAPPLTGLAPAVATGSHVDSQPAGGRLDGAWGICAGLEAIAALNEAGIVTRDPIEVIVWANEEGCRFAPGSLGAQAFVEPARLPALLDARDRDGVRYGDCVAALHRRMPLPPRAPGSGLKLFIEAHIEQGPVLEQREVPIGIVSGVQGVRWLRIAAQGQAAHAGTTPLAFRRDAMRACVELMQRLYGHAEQVPQLRLTVGSIDVAPGSINTVPGDAAFTLDLRHADAAQLDACERLVGEYCSSSRHGCRMTVERLMALPTTRFDAGLQQSLRASASELGLPTLDMLSGAFHDALHVARLCPTAMLFVPSRDGLSHNPAEHTDIELLHAGTRVLAQTLLRLAGTA